MGRMLLWGEEEEDKEIIQKMLLASCRGEKKLWGGRKEDNLILIAVRAVSILSAGNKQYNHNGGTAGTSHTKAAEQLQKTNSCKAHCPVAIFTVTSSFSTEPLIFWISSSTHPLLPFLSSLLPVFLPSYPSALAQCSFLSHLLLSILILLLSSIMDGLEISASCSGPRAPRARQTVLIPAPEDSSRHR